jgi:AI-2 transport protein TqsA
MTSQESERMPQEIGPDAAGTTAVPTQERPDLQSRERPDLRIVFLAIIALVLMGWALKGLSAVLMPLTAAILIALAVMPVRDWVKARVPGWMSWLGIVAAMAVVLLVLAVFVGVLVLAARQIVGELPVGAGDVVEMIQGGQEGESGQGGSGDGENEVAEGAEAGASGALEDAAGAEGQAGGGAQSGAEQAQEPAATEEGGLFGGSAMETFRTIGQRALGAAGGAAAAILNSAMAVLASLVLVLFLTLLILAESGDWRRKVMAALPWPDDWRLKESSDVIAQKARAYLLSQAGLGFISACLYAMWLGFWGIGLLLVWPLLIFVLNFIPTIGSLVGGTLPVAYTLITRDVGTAVIVGLGILAIENVMGNLVGPRIQGRNMALSPLVILLALAFWGWAWGIAGALLAVPVTVGMVVLGAHVPLLRPWALLLSNQTGWAGLDEATRPE